MTESNAFNPDVPNAARVYDYLLGGKDHYPADREAAEQVIAKLPGAQASVRWNRDFLHRLVRYLITEAGISQIIDIGAGLPTVGNTHEVAQAIKPGIRVVYADNDPVVLAHAHDMLHGVSGTAVIQHDLQDPDAILADPQLRELIRFDEPCGLMFLSMLHFIPDRDDPAGLIARLLEPFPSGSYARTRAEILTLVAGLDLVPPGLTWLQDWRPELGTVLPGNPEDAFYYAVVGRKP